MDSSNQPTIEKIENPKLRQRNLVAYSFGGYKIVVCIQCQEAKVASEVVGHLAASHGGDARLLNQELKPLFVDPDFGWATMKDLQGYQRALRTMKPQPFPGIVVSSKWLCEACNSLFTTEGSIKTHRSKCAQLREQEPHRRTGKSFRIKDLPFVECQTLLSSEGKSYFRVYPSGLAPVVLGAQDSQELELLKDVHQQRSDALDSVTDEDEVANPWLKRTRWLDFCGGDEELVLKTLAPMTSAQVSGEFEKISQATTRLLVSSLSNIENTSVFHLRRLRAPHDDIEGKPFERKQVVDTHNTYFAYLRRFVLYACRLYHAGESIYERTGVDMAPYKSHLEAILSLSGLSGYGEASGDLSLKILDFIIATITTPLPATASTKFVSPILNFLAAAGFDEARKYWKTAPESTQIFAGLSFCSRLLILRQAWRLTQDKLAEGESRDEVFDREFSLLVVVAKDQENYPMGEWLSQHAYAKIVSSNSYFSGKILWNAELTGIYYAGELFSLYRFRDFVGAIELHIQKLTEKQSFLREGERLKQFNLKDIFDDPSRRSRGYSFVKDPKNEGLSNPAALLEKILADPVLRDSFFPGEGYAEARVGEYFKADVELRKWIALAILITSGVPPRGPELLTLRKYNTGGDMRSFIVLDGELVIFTDYNKTRAISGLMKAICRFFPPTIAQNVVHYLLYIDPFVEYLKKRTGWGVDSPYMFTDKKGRPWDAGILSNFLRDHSKVIMGFPCKIASYRQISAAISKQFVRGMSEMIEMVVRDQEDMISRQFGHTRAVHEIRYGADVRTTAETQEINVREFLKVSKQYQFFIGAIPALPDWLLKISDIYFVGDGKHPTFRHPAYPAKYVVDAPPRHFVEAAETTISAEPSRQAVAAPARERVVARADEEPVFTSVGSGLYRLDEPFPFQLHAQLFKQYSSTSQGLVTWKLPEQAKAAEAIFRNNVSPLLVVLPCAAGKTTAALLAVAAGNGITIIIEPFISTCQDVERRALDMGISAVYWNHEQPRSGGLPINAPGVIITTPEGGTSKYFVTEVAKLHLARRLDRVIIDEIHQPLLDEGFRDTFRISMMTNLKVPIVMLTATMPPLMVPSLKSFLNFPTFVEIRAPTNIKNLAYRVGVGKPRSEIEKVLGDWMASCSRVSQPLDNKIIVFCRSKTRAQELSTKFNAPSYTGQMDMGEREKNLKRWRGEGGILFATTALGPGVDTQGVCAVFGIDVPWTLVEFVQQGARAGRGGSKAYNVLFCGPPKFQLPNFVNRTPWRIQSQKAICDFVTTKECRRRIISYFMDGVSVDCLTLGPGTEPCDNCRKSNELFAQGVFDLPEENFETPRVSAVVARNKQTQRIIDYLRMCRYHCPFCLFLSGSKPGHVLKNCPYRRRPRTTRFESGSCEQCGIPNSHCINSSEEIGCQNSGAVFGIIEAVFEDEEIRERVYGEAGVRELELKTYDKLLGWMIEGKVVEGKMTSNCWVLLQTLEELNLLTVSD
ncbi:hypothetical protein TWF730_000005 [Orbilia blumenaviensis]|uniref:DNA 3'-5' helicase n=1 Tax=Orbilia blumenaviensis TaxID=1796055 RepID=A0AAV9VKL0_9PEZI